MGERAGVGTGSHESRVGLLRRGLCELRREKNLCNREETGRRTGSTDPVCGRSAREEEEEEGVREGEREEDFAPTWLPSGSSKSSKICRRIRQHHAVPVRIWSTIVGKEFGNCRYFFVAF
jgi:hypothetical protein